jgi:hypothetical protein
MAAVIFNEGSMLACQWHKRHGIGRHLGTNRCRRSGWKWGRRKSREANAGWHGKPVNGGEWVACGAARSPNPEPTSLNPCSPESGWAQEFPFHSDLIWISNIPYFTICVSSFSFYCAAAVRNGLKQRAFGKSRKKLRTVFRPSACNNRFKATWSTSHTREVAQSSIYEQDDKPDMFFSRRYDSKQQKSGHTAFEINKF